MLQKAFEIASNSQEDVKEHNHADLSEVALGRNGRPQEVAHLIAYLLSDESTYISGNDISIDGGWRC